MSLYWLFAATVALKTGYFRILLNGKALRTSSSFPSTKLLFSSLLATLLPQPYYFCAVSERAAATRPGRRSWGAITIFTVANSLLETAVFKLVVDLGLSSVRFFTPSPPLPSSPPPPSPSSSSSSSLLSSSKKAVQWLSYQLSPRAMLFRRDGNSLTSAADLRSLMRSNTFKNKKDPLSNGDPIAAICGRGDLEEDSSKGSGPNRRQASGCFDAKVTSWSRAGNLDADAVAGPTTAGGTLPPFSWKDDPEFEKVPHRGLPEVFDFEYERFAPRLEARVKGGNVGGGRERVSQE